MPFDAFRARSPGSHPPGSTPETLPPGTWRNTAVANPGDYGERRRQPFAGVGGFGVACAAVEHYWRQLAVENGPQVRACWVSVTRSPDAPGVRDAWQAYGEQKGLSFEEVHREVCQGRAVATGHALGADRQRPSSGQRPAAGMTATMANVTSGAQVDRESHWIPPRRSGILVASTTSPMEPPSCPCPDNPDPTHRSVPGCVPSRWQRHRRP